MPINRWPWSEKPYNENVFARTYGKLALREWSFGQRREAAVCQVTGSAGYPVSDYRSALTVQIFLRPSGLQNRSGLPGEPGLGLLEGD